MKVRNEIQMGVKRKHKNTNHAISYIVVPTMPLTVWICLKITLVLRISYCY